MKYKLFFSTFLLLITLSLTNCKKDCEPQIAACNETAPTDEACQAYFNRWFFNKENNKCEQIGYSGCSQKGFASQQECEECKCN